MKTEKNCEVYDIKRTGNTQTFKMRCTGKDAMEGAGEFTYVGKDHYTGKMQVKTGGETMTMSYEGQKLGSCDGGEMNLKAKDDAGRSARSSRPRPTGFRSRRCHEMAAQGTSPDMMKSVLQGPGRIARCSARPSRTHDKLATQAKIEKTSNGINQAAERDSAAMCGFDVKTRAHPALRDRRSATSKIDFIAAQCPAEADQLAAGPVRRPQVTRRSADKYRSFCSQYARVNRPTNTPAGKVKGLLKGHAVSAVCSAIERKRRDPAHA